MRMLAKILKRIWAAYFYLIFSLIFLLMYPAFWYTLRKEERYPVANRLRRTWAHLVLALTGVTPRVKVIAEFDKDRPVIYCANHSSLIDVIIFGTLIGDDYRFMAKKEFGDIPIFGIFFRTLDIPVDRHDRGSAFRAFRQAEQSLKQGYDLIIFPEGTTTPQGPAMLDFKNGPFKLAIDHKIPIVPITFMDNWYLLPWKGGWSAMPGYARTIVHAPVTTGHLDATDVEWLRDEVFGIIESPLRKEYESRYSFG